MRPEKKGGWGAYREEEDTGQAAAYFIITA